MLSGSAWAGRRDRAFASVEHPQKRRLAEWMNEWEDKRARRRAEFAARIPVMATEMASEISAAAASEENAAVAAVLDVAFARNREAILDAVITMDRARASSASTPTSSPSNMHALAVALDCTSSPVQAALAAPTTYSTQCPSHDATMSVSALAPAAKSVSSKVTMGIVPERHCYFDPEPAAVASTPNSALDVTGACSTRANYLTHETDRRSVTPSTCSTVFPEGNTSTTSTPSSQALVPTSSASTQTSPTTFPVVGDLLGGGDDLTSTSSFIYSILCHDGTTALVQSSKTDAPLPTLHILDFAAALIANSDSGCSDIDIVPVPEVLDGISLTTSADPNNDTPQDDQGLLSTVVIHLNINNGSALTLKQVAAQPQGTLDMFRILPRMSLSPIFEKSATGNMTQFLPWDPGQPLHDMGTKLSALEHGLVVMLTTASGVACLQGNSVHELFCSSVEVDTIKKCMMPLAELQPWPSWELSILVVHCHYARVYFQWKIAVRKYNSSSGFLAFLNGRADVQRHYSCTRVLTDNVSKGWISCHILRDNNQFPELMQWSLSHALLQSEFEFHTAGYVLFFCCALVQWEVPWTISLVSRKSSFQYCIVGCESLYGCQNFQWTIAWSLGYQISLSSLQTRLYCVILWVQQNCPPIYQEKWFRFLTVGLSGAGSAYVCIEIVTVMFWPHFNLGMLLPLHCRDLSFWRYPSVDQTMLKPGHAIQYGLELIHWKIAWPLYLVCSTSGNKSGKLFHLTKVRSEGYLAKRNAALQSFSTRTVQVFLLVNWSRAHHTGICGCHYLTSGSASTVPFQFLAYVAMWSFCNLEFCQGKLSWDPGIWALLCFFGLLIQAEAKGRRTAAAPIYCRGHCLDHAYYCNKVCADQGYYIDVFCDHVQIGHDYNIGIFLEQVPIICYFNLVKVCFTYGARRDLGEVMTHLVLWDPGSSTWHRLEVKPEFKEGGMLATLLPARWADSDGLGLLGLGDSEPAEASDYKYTAIGIRETWLGSEGFGLGLAGCSLLLLVFFLLCSSVVLF